jgi:hypothetical protein
MSDVRLRKYIKCYGTLQWTTSHKIFSPFTLDIHIQFGEQVCLIRVSVPRRAKEGDGVKKPQVS